MKNLILSSISLLFTAYLTAQSVDSQSQKFIEAFVKDNIDTKVETVDQTALSKVFFGEIF